MLTIHLDRQITRRKFYHILSDEAGEVLYRSKRFSDLLAILEAMDQTETRLNCPEGRCVIMTLRAEN